MGRVTTRQIKGGEGRGGGESLCMHGWFLGFAPLWLYCAWLKQTTRRAAVSVLAQTQAKNWGLSRHTKTGNFPPQKTKRKSKSSSVSDWSSNLLLCLFFLGGLRVSDFPSHFLRHKTWGEREVCQPVWGSQGRNWSLLAWSVCPDTTVSLSCLFFFPCLFLIRVTLSAAESKGGWEVCLDKTLLWQGSILRDETAFRLCYFFAPISQIWTGGRLNGRRSEVNFILCSNHFLADRLD